MLKQRTGRIREEENQMFEQHQAKTGESWNAFLHRAIRTMLGQQDSSLDSVEEVNGSAASILFESGTLFNWDESKRQRLNTKKPLYLVAEGYLWLVDRTRNYSHRILKKVCKVPELLLTGHASRYLEHWVMSGLKAIFKSLQTLTALAQASWFKVQPWRGKAEYIVKNAIDGEELESIEAEYNPLPVEEVTAPVEVPTVKVEKPTVTRLTKQQLRKVYNIAIDIWQRYYSNWRSNGYQSPEGIWNWNTAENVWVLSNG